MATWVWNGGAGNWSDQSNWKAEGTGENGLPQPGDTVVIASGNPEVGAITLEDMTIVLGSTDGSSPAILTADSTIFAAGTVIMNYGETAFARLEVNGDVSLAGALSPYAKGGILTVNIAGGASFTSTGIVTSGEVAGISIIGEGTFVNNKLLSAVGAGRLVLGEDLVIEGTGRIAIGNGAVVTINGAVPATQEIVFKDNGTLVVQDLASFKAVIAAFSSGNKIDLPELTANEFHFDSTTGILQVEENGVVVGEMTFSGVSGPGKFELAPLTGGGTLIEGYVPSTVVPPEIAAPDLFPTLPIALRLTPGETITLEDALTQAFGSDFSGYKEFYIYYTGQEAWVEDRFSFWDPKNPSMNEWLVNGTSIGSGDANLTRVTADQLSSVELKAGNVIGANATILVPIAYDDNGNAIEYASYKPIVVNPDLIPPPISGRAPTPDDIVAMAKAYAKVYFNIPNTNDCFNIGKAIAASVGAALPDNAYNLDPSDNADGGFWRVVYRGDEGEPVLDWSTLVKPGDIVRMAWPAGGGHTTTVIKGVGSDGQILVYDNDSHAPGFEAIGEHYADYAPGTLATGITIFRLAEDARYLIAATDLTETLQGTIHDDDIRPNGGLDSITGGPGDDLVQGLTAQMNGITFTDFTFGDTLGFNDLATAGIEVSYGQNSGEIFVSSNGEAVAAIKIGEPLDAPIFTVTGDGKGGSIIGAVSGTDVVAAAVAPLYAILDRLPDAPGLDFWRVGIESGLQLDDVAATFLASAEFQSEHGEVSDGGFVELLYNTYFDRAPDVDGYAFWLEALEDGAIDRATLLVGFTQSAEYHDLHLA
ncbi:MULTISPECIES: DUF4214 domain-containing protein [unclassified Chelatococcus]|uniref:DUF4214 domain-containing protein n=1 Tax=unclassified Chelatococcus TaxID=2638111 RepID=UPI001BCFC413|nr:MULTISPECIES: DUF4214 domain-containing protein [unclassified Chelatococcus]CAH1670917.1 hypothetical protein CHELA20_50704 [Hyphomicrobiales bacterium]MBS7739140.1 DUF4214 domain-containing protein [Chelatococcus sp. HY11]MBX3543630.1 DUF4214 domain-containing protein [Chelatococcus sp.]MCO5076328.1 DUF4214 domain-containing protein [Chelatococcus sp.]CAH1676885.1 hypothetical protein CHELA41_24315 [Hyphomicrobiales bacterium]